MASTALSSKGSVCPSCGKVHPHHNNCYLKNRTCRHFGKCVFWTSGGCNYHHLACPHGIHCTKQDICQYKHHSNHRSTTIEEEVFARDYPNSSKKLTTSMVLDCCLFTTFGVPVELRHIITHNYLYNMSPFDDVTLKAAVKKWYTQKPEALLIYGPISDWDTSLVTSMNELFIHLTFFNEPIGRWNVSNVTDMSGMFQGCWWFNQPIGNWDVSKVKWMSSMFLNAGQFNQDLSGWDTSNVSTMQQMFYYATNFNQPLSWNVSNVVYTNSMFENAVSFNQPLKDWNLNKVEYMRSMFQGAMSFNQPIDHWDVSKVTNMINLFENAISFNQPLDRWYEDSTKHDILKASKHKQLL